MPLLAAVGIASVGSDGSRRIRRGGGALAQTLSKLRDQLVPQLAEHAERHHRAAGDLRGRAFRSS